MTYYAEQIMQLRKSYTSHTEIKRENCSPGHRIVETAILNH